VPYASIKVADRDHRTVKVLEVRGLTRADLETLRQPVARTSVKTLKDSHHRIARLVAIGKNNLEIAAEAGMSIGRISQLRQDPAFMNLVADYRAEVHEIWKDHVDHMAEMAVTNMIRAEAQIGDQLAEAEEFGEKIPLRDLARITADRMDRFGYGKHTTALNVNVGFAARLEQAIHRSRKTIEIDQ
jgi:DNA-binding CsgD family transcriptional regulator